MNTTAKALAVVIGTAAIGLTVWLLIWIARVPLRDAPTEAGAGFVMVALVVVVFIAESVWKIVKGID